MARRRYMDACAVAMTVALTSGCIMFGGAKPSILEPKDTPSTGLNDNENKFPNRYPLDKDWDVYRGKLEQLIGIIVFVIPDPSYTSKYSTVVYDRAITESASSKIDKEMTNEVVYSSKVEGRFGANLSFVIGRVEMKQDHLYEVTLKESNSVTIDPDSNLLDSQKLSHIFSQAPDTFYHAYWVTGVKHANLVVKDYWHIERQGDASYSLIKVGGKYYTGDETTSILPTIFIVGIEQGSIFGILNSQTGLYTKRTAVNLPTGYEPQRPYKGQQLNFQQLEIEPLSGSPEEPASPEEDEKVRKAVLKLKPSQLKLP